MSLLDRLKQLGDSALRRSPAVDPARWGDPVALSTQWTPLKPGGANFRTHTLTERDGNQLAYGKSVAFFLFGGLFLVVGLGCSGIGLANGEWIMTVFGLPFAAVGGWVLRPNPTVFDGGTRQFTSGGKSTAFGSIHAIQIIQERVTSSDDPDYWSYELNLVLKDGARVHVVDHGDLASIRGDAQRLAAQIGCKLWDGSESSP